MNVDIIKMLWDNIKTMPTQKNKTQLSNVILIQGDNELMKDKFVDNLLSELVSDEYRDFDLETIEGEVGTAERILSGLNAIPFGSNKKVVLIKRANKLDNSEQAKLSSAISSIPSGSCLILLNPPAEIIDGKPKKGSSITRELQNSIKKYGRIENFDFNKNDAAPTAAKLFEQYGKKIARPVLEQFIRGVGNNISIILSEVEKLVSYVGDADTITIQDIDAVTCIAPEEKIFKLIDAVCSGSTSTAIRLLQEHFDGIADPRVAAQRTLATISRQFRLLWQMKMLMESGVKSYSKDSLPPEIKSSLISNPNIIQIITRHEWQRNKLQQQASRFNKRMLCLCFDSILRADTALKGAGGDDEITDPQRILELLIFRISNIR